MISCVIRWNALYMMLFCVGKRVLRSKSVVPGWGAVEVALSIYCKDYTTSVGSREQLAITSLHNLLLFLGHWQLMLLKTPLIWLQS